MVFSSTIFLFLFLPVVMILYFTIFRAFKNLILFGASLIFYAWGEGHYVLILLLSIFANYLFGLLLNRYKDHMHIKPLLVVAICFNVGLLIFFKYLNLIVETLNPALSILNLPTISMPPVHLPLGISFFTFQAITYIVDIYRNVSPYQKKFINVGLYISSFPQLIAGPIVRYSDVADQIPGRSVTHRDFAMGIERFIIGLGKKVLLANPLAKIADQIFALAPDQLTTPIAWLGITCYTLQIYFDFSGYSDMAIGLGRMFGFRFPENFNFPYISKSVTEYWRRWHITLSLWFRDYLYIPLGGNRHGNFRTYVNLIIVFFLCGLWHGASWKYILWGLYHGCFLIIERAGFDTILSALWRPLRHAYMLLVITIGFVIFRSDTLSYAGPYMLTMFGFGTPDATGQQIIHYINAETLLVLCLAILFSMPVKAVFENFFQSAEIEKNIRSVVTISHGFFKLAALSLLLLAASMCIASGAYNPFIYFRF